MKTGLPTVQQLLAEPLFCLSNPTPAPIRLKLSTTVKDGLKGALINANNALIEDQKAVKQQRKESKVKKEVEVDSSVKRKAARKVK